ncbi:MAG: NYN domain-containing protein [Rhodocyclaceae bacterium]|nr:NYN domain-containing protein [Rhodocyclaceae bacterium]MBX3671071.1 NYN domain-containing protein [Rhodocyclaceae bacterium]
MTDSYRGQVALLIDFENLVFGLQDTHGEDFAEFLDPGLLMRLAEEYGQVVVANAYGDWRSRDLNQFQIDLYRLGIDLVHVLARKQLNRMKNAVDVKMAVDAVESVWTLPHVKTFVIVSGDRDFIHVLKALRRHGRTVIGVSPDQAVSEDFAGLCDRFVRYGALSATLMPESASAAARAESTANIEDVREALRTLLQERPGGIKGAQVKPLLRRKLSATFDESEYGYTRLTDMLAAMSDVVRVVPDLRGGDVSVVPADSPMDGESAAPGDYPAAAMLAPRSHHPWASRARLGQYAFDADAGQRRKILLALFHTMHEREPFTLAEIFARVVQDSDTRSVTISALAKYQHILWQSRVFVLERDQQDKPVRDRLMRLEPGIRTPEELVRRYEASIAYKLHSAARGGAERLTPEILASVLGLGADPEALEYCAGLMPVRGAMASGDAPRPTPGLAAEAAEIGNLG